MPGLGAAPGLRLSSCVVEHRSPVAARALARAAAVLLLLGLLVAPVDALLPTGRAAEGRVVTTVRGFSTTPLTLPAARTVRTTVRVLTGGRGVPRRAVLQVRPPRGSWTAVAGRRTDAAGRVTLATTVRRTVALRVHVPATRRARAATTRERWVRVGSTRSGTPEAELLRRVDAARATGRWCGRTWVRAPRTPALARDARLMRAAEDYADRLAGGYRLAHVDAAGNDPGDRATAAGYAWSRLGENLAAGQDTPAAVVRAWLASPSHCRNLMGDWVHVGVGHVRRAGTTHGDYWVQLLGRPA